MFVWDVDSKQPDPLHRTILDHVDCLIDGVLLVRDNIFVCSHIDHEEGNVWEVEGCMLHVFSRDSLLLLR